RAHTFLTATMIIAYHLRRFCAFSVFSVLSVSFLFTIFTSQIPVDLRRPVLYLIFLLAAIQSAAQPALQIHDSIDQQFFIFAAIEYFEDPAGDITITDVADGKYDHLFTPSPLYNPT